MFWNPTHPTQPQPQQYALLINDLSVSPCIWFTAEGTVTLAMSTSVSEQKSCWNTTLLRLKGFINPDRKGFIVDIQTLTLYRHKGGHHTSNSNTHFHEFPSQLQKRLHSLMTLFSALTFYNMPRSFIKNTDDNIVECICLLILPVLQFSQLTAARRSKRKWDNAPPSAGHSHLNDCSRALHGGYSLKLWKQCKNTLVSNWQMLAFPFTASTIHCG